MQKGETYDIIGRKMFLVNYIGLHLMNLEIFFDFLIYNTWTVWFIHTLWIVGRGPYIYRQPTS